MDKSTQIAEIIIHGFQRHFILFKQITLKAKELFEKAQWQALRYSNSQRISFYTNRVRETIEQLHAAFPGLQLDEPLWAEIKKKYAEYLVFHPQVELAETFYNSVFCKLFDKRYYHNDNIFVETTIDPSNLPVPMSSVYESYFPALEGLKPTLEQILLRFQFDIPYEDIHRDIRYIIRSFIKQTPDRSFGLHQMRIDVLKSIFYRNKGAYIVGRIVNPNGQLPFIIPLLNRKDKQKEAAIYADALIMRKRDMITTFGFYHTYFMVETEAPSSLVNFLQELMPEKSISELYSAIGFHKQGKTEFYRIFLNHLEQSDDQFIEAPGIEGMVMLVFTLPSFPYVFKVIKDKFPPSKNFSHHTVKERYYLVKQHDRVGRMADTLEYSDVAIPKGRFSNKLLALLRKQVGRSLEENNDVIFFKHIYIQRRVKPLNLLLDELDEAGQFKILDEYAQAIRDMIGVNIFPGDLLLKNFGITKFKRVIFYDYDEVQYLLNMNFRPIPKPQTIEQELAAEPWYSVGPYDVFPEEFPTFITANETMRNYLTTHHADLFDPSYWQTIQYRVRHAIFQDVFPYPLRFRFPSFVEKGKGLLKKNSA
ncbi:bifunctional isocitrate dehydrogenase kinase/phosphatase [Legionella sp. W05-934-2]|jgi:isocitrate dehydrogenase kinase/phosphatase|uniref:bifunctional isocitrate dehydrogenase kinase/phosphatase n=1 Tax=Legionella sp. W05-934-2 TaxID=1198649 RepID=UPI0034622135